MLSTYYLPLYKEEHMDKLLGEQFWLPMYMAGAQCKTLILNTDVYTHRSRQKNLYPCPIHVVLNDHFPLFPII